ncbi:hypothetical protein HDU83_004048 [Entophlyctis luteolus]|nr:hypothetical protein HDU83_004048 [Entophlyctis luteolus]
MDWSSAERLVCVADIGTVRVFDLWGESYSFSLGQEAKDFGILDCRFWGAGFVALTGNFKLICIEKLSDPRPKLLADPGISYPPASWLAIPPHLAPAKQPTVILSVKSTLLSIDGTAVQDQRLQTGPYTSMTLSPNGKFIALFNSNSAKLFVISADFTKQLAEFSVIAAGVIPSIYPPAPPATSNNNNIPATAATGAVAGAPYNSSFLSSTAVSSPLQIAWCGNDSVVLHWEDIVLVVGPFGDFIKYSVDGVVVLVGATEDVFKIGSTSPGAILYDACDNFARKNPRADENIRGISGDLSLAVDTCLEAALHEYSSVKQKSLLRAASFGKSFIPDYDSTKFTNVCETIRVLNAVRRFEVGRPLTFEQLKVLIGRLTQARQHSLALSICEFLKMNPVRVLVHWACTKIKTANLAGDANVQAVFAEIVDKLTTKAPLITFVPIAQTAYHYGHTALASQLLDHEPVAANQVPMLLSMDLDERALSKAVASGNADLAYAVVMHVKRKCNMAEFFRLVSRSDSSTNSTGSSIANSNIGPSSKRLQRLVEAYARGVGDTQLLKDFYYQDDRRADLAAMVFGEAFDARTYPARVGKLREAARLFAESAGKPPHASAAAVASGSAGSRANPAAAAAAASEGLVAPAALAGPSSASRGSFENKAIDDHVRLLALQASLERDTGHTFCELTVTDTIRKCLVIGHPQRAAKVKTDMKVPDRRFAWIQMAALVETRNWAALDKVGGRPATYLVVFESRMLKTFKPQFVKSSAKYVPVASVVELLHEKGETAQAKLYENQQQQTQQQHDGGAGGSFFSLWAKPAQGADGGAPNAAVAPGSNNASSA